MPSAAMKQDRITEAVLEREEVRRYLQGSPGQSSRQARERVYAYIDELRTTQRYPFYRLLQHPLYPLLRKIKRIHSGIEIVKAAGRKGRVIYASNHKSHTDYLVEPLVLDDNGIRPPIIAAGINLFGGPLGLIHRHVTGAMPIRRATKDPGYLTVLKAYVAELLREHDLLFYPEGGRSYSGEMKPPKTGLIHAAMQAGHENLVIIPTAIAYDVVLEDRALARQGGVKKRQRAFATEIAEMVRLAVGYRSRAWVNFGQPIRVADYNPEVKRDVMDLAHRTRDAIGRLHKVMPTAVVASAIRPSNTRRELESRADAIIDRLREVGADLAVESGRQAIEEGATALVRRGVLVAEGGRFRVRERTVVRYYARSIQHLLDLGKDGTD